MRNGGFIIRPGRQFFTHHLKVSSMKTSKFLCGFINKMHSARLHYYSIIHLNENFKPQQKKEWINYHGTADKIRNRIKIVFHIIFSYRKRVIKLTENLEE